MIRLASSGSLSTSNSVLQMPHFSLLPMALGFQTTSGNWWVHKNSGGKKPEWWEWTKSLFLSLDPHDLTTGPHSHSLWLSWVWCFPLLPHQSSLTIAHIMSLPGSLHQLPMLQLQTCLTEQRGPPWNGACQSSQCCYPWCLHSETSQTGSTECPVQWDVNQCSVEKWGEGSTSQINW